MKLGHMPLRWLSDMCKENFVSKLLFSDHQQSTGKVPFSV